MHVSGRRELGGRFRLPPTKLFVLILVAPSLLQQPVCRHQGLSYGQSVALIVTSIVLSCTLVGALAVLGYKWHKTRQKAQADVAFEAALQDSGLGLDDAFEQVGFSQDFLLLTIGRASCWSTDSSSTPMYTEPFTPDVWCQTVTHTEFTLPLSI